MFQEEEDRGKVPCRLNLEEDARATKGLEKEGDEGGQTFMGRGTGSGKGREERGNRSLLP